MILIDTINALSLTEKRALVKTIKGLISEQIAANRQLKIDAKAEKQANIALKREIAIAKAQVRLQKLLDKASAPVGTKAIKANRKPSKGIVYGAEDNAIAAAIMARKQVA